MGLPLSKEIGLAMNVSVLVVDDSALMRSLIGQIVEKTPGLHIADKAMNGRFALEKIPHCNPDVIVLDIEMPEMNGIEFLKERKRRGIKIPVIILSSLAKEGARITMECLNLGASDFITKPGGSASEDIQVVAKHLGTLLLAYGAQYQIKKRINGEKLSSQTNTQVTSISTTEKTQNEGDTSSNLETYIPLPQVKKVKPEIVIPKRKTGKIELIAIGISTGGPNALRTVFAGLSKNLEQPILVVQHMPAGFTEEFAKSLNRICPLDVKEAEEGDIIKPGRILIAPGDFHIQVEKKPLASIVHLSSAPLRNGHRPSADVLFESVAAEYKNHALGIIMTGMGKDGCDGLGKMFVEGAATLGQDESSCIVYGMPKAAYEAGFVQKQVSLSRMAEEISTIANQEI